MKQESFLFSSTAGNQDAEKAGGFIHPKIYSVGELVTQARDLVKEHFSSLWVSGEISGFRPSQAGHLYFSLKDEKAVVSVVMFKGLASRLPFRVEDGLEVVVSGSLSIYPPTGKFQLEAQHMEPVGVGALQLAFEQLKKRLGEEGLFDPAHKKALPFLPRRVGVVTSPTGAAIRDIVNVAQRRFSNLSIIISPARVQGEGAAEEIAQAIRLLDRHGHVDVIIVGRGGGSMEDLWCFNEEGVARAIFEAKTPVVSAVGHEIDFTIADFVADLRAATPSAAAELVVPLKSELYQLIRDRKNRMATSLRHDMAHLATRWQGLRSRMRVPTSIIAESLQKVDFLREKTVGIMMHQILERYRARLLTAANQLGQLSPAQVLSRGYALLTRAVCGTVVKESNKLSVGELLNATLHQGTLILKVEKIGE